MDDNRNPTDVSRFGAVPAGINTAFRVWAPRAQKLEVTIEGQRDDISHPLLRSDDGTFTGSIEGVRAGDRYRYRLDGGEELPDPASRYQPAGVNGPSEVVDPWDFVWTDGDWGGVPREQLVIYELHVGTFTTQGTFAGVESRLRDLADLGVTAIELMPLAECAGRWNWGYDGVDLFAPSHNYGTPDDLRRLVNAAHAYRLAVIVDVVYNHFGPDGAHIHSFSDQFRTDRYQTPWGDGINLDGDGSRTVREFFFANALHWIHEYHVDGLRVDASHALRDGSQPHFLAELAAIVRGAVTGRHVLLIAEDERNDATIVTDRRQGGFGFDGVWADDLHHHIRRAVAGDNEGYFQSYSGTTADIVETLRSGWYFKGQFCQQTCAPRGSDPTGIPLDRFVICLQNHDQVGNRARGERLHHQIDSSIYRALSALLLLAPETPLLFMGQEWAASSPFLYFTDHEPALGEAITEGRRAEFAAFSAYSEPASRSSIPDPQNPETFYASRLKWTERDQAEHAGTLRLYAQLLALRRSLVDLGGAAVDIRAAGDQTILMRRTRTNGEVTLVLVCLAGEGSVAIDCDARNCRVALTTEDPEFALDGRPPSVDAGEGLRVTFHGAAAIVLNETRVQAVRPSNDLAASSSGS